MARERTIPQPSVKMDREHITFQLSPPHHLWSHRPNVTLCLTVQVIGSLVGLVALIAAGVTIGIILSNNNKHSSSSSSSSSSASNSSSQASAVGPSGVVQQTDPNDPSTFVPDSRLHQSFYGIAYTPEGSQLPECGNSIGGLAHICIPFG